MNPSKLKRLGRSWRYSALVVLAVALVSSADVSPPMPVVDLSVGPIAVTAQAANIALALSVEFPTAGAAYRTTQYDHSQTYLGYWDASACYEYFDESDTSALAGHYFRRTGTTYPAHTTQTDTTKNGYCNTGDLDVGTGYSGNLLNYAATSSIDLLRFALTGGDRVLDTPTRTVLARAFLPSDFKGGADAFRNGSYWPQKQVNGTLTGKVTPLFKTSTGATNTNTIYLNSCDDVLFVGDNATAGTCTNPSTANSWATRTPNLPGTWTPGDYIVAPPDTTTTTYVLEGTRTWGRAANNATTTTLPSGFDAGAGTLTPEPVVPTPRNSTVTGTASTPQVAGDPVYATNWDLVAGQTVPNVTASLQAQGYPVQFLTTTYAIRPAVGNAYKEGILAEVQANAPKNKLRTGASVKVCGPTKGNRLQANSANNKCSDGSTVNNNSNVDTYQLYIATDQYQAYKATPVYRYYQTVDTWYVPAVYTRYKVYTNGLAPARMKARVEVCTSVEAATRPNLCTRFPDGNYKPTGQVQVNSVASRLSAFGYVMENARTRYGGVLRAPMRFLGPQYRDTAGVMQNNASSEWNVNNGVFTTDPLNAAPTSARSGLINYLNKFGSTGVYKSFDPVGELYYEALRYFQGLPPTAGAASGLTTAMYDSFPVYNNVVSATSTVAGWTDPIQNACQRKNFIMVIGDVNTHNDRQLPGHGGSMVTTEDPARAVETVPGGTNTFDASYWTSLITGFETAGNVSYNDAKGIARNTLGNPNVVASNTTLQSKGTGSGSNSAYYWAGAAYWANTQPIRKDLKAGESLKEVRVKTFTIDVDENGNGTIDSNAARGIAPRNSSFFLAGKYGWFNDANLDGSPFKTSGGLINNQEWEDPDVPNTPDGYVIASQAQKLVDAIEKFFKATSLEKGAVSVSSLSSQRFTTQEPNGDLFAPRFDTRDWSGTVQRSGLRLNTSTDSIDTLAGVKWDAGAILRTASFATSAMADPYVRPADRKIFTMSRGAGTTTGQAFTVANKGNLDAAVLTALNTNPASATATLDSRADARIEWLRGMHTDELTSTSGFLRRRTNVMGDVINSGPVFKQGADPDVRGPGYGTFAQTINNRLAMIYVGANDGMLHGFRATDGKEMFAYIPRAVAQNLNKLTNPNYIHQPFVDGVPHVGEAQVGTSWKTVLASGMGGGAQGVFALDVTAPDSFGAGHVMFEFTDLDDPDMGNVLMQPKIVKMRMAGTGTPVYKWFIAVGSGYNNYRNDGNYSSTGKQALFLLSLDKAAGSPWQLNTNYYKAVLADPVSTAVPTGLGNPGFTTGAAGEAIYFYSGDLQGNLWRFNFVNGLDGTNATNSVKVSGGAPVPIAISKDGSGTIQPITTSPQVTSAPGKGYMVVFGTGKFLEPADSGNTAIQTMYGVWDNLTSTASDFQLGRAKLYQRTMVGGTSTATLTGSATFVLGTAASGSNTYRGWFVDLTLNAGERIATEGASGLGFAAFNSTIPDGSCSGDGTGRSMCFTPTYGTAACDFTTSDAGLLSRPNVVTVISDDVAEAYTSRASTGRRMSAVRQALISTGTKITDAGNVAAITAKVTTPPLPAGRLGWREVRNFKDN